ncbi:hypothetical protein VW41_18525 [Klebsiella michiganensis]|nr:hypothetical protein VW41_18525 [Klebsiella michiganensis]
MSKTDYILRSLAKISGKRWEHYTINRIYHLLNDPDLEFICQQCIRKNDGKIYLADLFFPQLGLYLEIDEGHHDSEDAKIRDAIRRLDITEATGFREERIPASNVTINELDKYIDKFIKLVKELKSTLLHKKTFEPWDYEHRYTACNHIKKGMITVGPEALFRHHKDALNCFGYEKGHHQAGHWNIPEHVNKIIGLEGKNMIWFPKLYEQKDWKNSLSDDGKVITEYPNDLEKSYTERWDHRIVMAHSRDELNRTLYRFLGVFRADPATLSSAEKKFIRTATSVKIFPKCLCKKTD